MTWSDEHCVMLCREILAVNPFTGSKKGSLQRGAKWKLIADNLLAIEKPKFKVDARAVREKYASLSGKLRDKLKAEERETGTNPENSEMEDALEELLEQEEEAEKVQKEDSDVKKSKDDADRSKAEKMRKRAMQSLGESSKKDDDDDEDDECLALKKKKRRSNGSDTLMFLREKSEVMQEIKKEELDMKKKEMELQEKKHDDYLKVIMTQQQQQSQQFQNFQTMMMAMMNRLTEK